MKRIITIVAALILLPLIASARPQYSILQSFGTKCQNCHVAPNVGMQRTNSGWMSRKDISLINPSTLGMQGLFDAIGESNTLFDDKVTYGLDFRYQTARWGKPTKQSVTYPHFEDPTRDTTINYTNPYGTERDYMLMILTPYLSIKPIDGISLEGSYNFAYDIETKKRYPGQLAYTGAITFNPGDWLPSLADYLPSLKIGYMQPMVGTDWDDHTYMTRQFVTPTATPPIVPCDYIELGAQLDYQAIDWLGISLGVYDSKNLKIITQNYTSDQNLSGLFKVTLHPPDFGTGITAYCGGTVFVNGVLKSDNGLYFKNHYFSVQNIFFHFGMADKWAVMTEWMHTITNNARETDNYTVELNYQLTEPVILYARLERGNTIFESARGNMYYHGNKYSIGSKLFVLPYIALIPEYKIYDRTHVDSYSSQFACQLHIFY